MLSIRTMLMNDNRIVNIEILRIIGCVAIILVHLFNSALLFGTFPEISLYKNFSNMLNSATLAVDLFFILAGFFFAYKLNLNKSCWLFIKHKLIRLYPVLVFIIILYFIFSLTGSLKFTFYGNILVLLFLNGTSLFYKFANAGHFWYVSAMFWSLLFYYYLLKTYSKHNVNLLTALIILFSYSFLIHAQNGAVTGTWQTYYNFINAGMLRALGGIGIGYFIGEWYKANIENIKNWKATTLQIISLSGLEFVTLYFIINNLMLHKLKYNNQFIFIIAFTTIIILFLIKKGIFSKFLDSNLIATISKYTYSIYMVHYPILFHLKGSVWKNHTELVYAHPLLNVVLTLLLVFIAGVLTYHFVEKPSYKYLTERFDKTPENGVAVERERARERARASARETERGIPLFENYQYSIAV